MHSIKQHTAFRFLTIALLFAILLPSAVKLAHAFQNHHHEVCLGQQKAHLHNLDIECEFYKFKVNNTFTLSDFHLKFIAKQNAYKVITHEYDFSSVHQPLHFSLRAPPLLV